MLGKFRKDHYEETDDEEEKLVEEMQKPKDEEEHVNSTLNMGNQLKSLLKSLVEKQKMTD